MAEEENGGGAGRSADVATVPEPKPPREIPHSELIATILMALAAILTAWSGFQAAKWGGVQATDFSAAGASRTESTRASTTAGQEIQLDVTTFLNWLNAASEDLRLEEIPDPDTTGGYQPTPDTLSGFLFERFRSEFEPAVLAWLETSPFTDPTAPSSPFEMPEYVVASAVEAEELREVAEDFSRLAREANQNGDNYVVMTILSALVIFFAGLASKLIKPRNQAIALGLGILIFVGTVITVLTLPIEV